MVIQHQRAGSSPNKSAKQQRTKREYGTKAETELGMIYAHKTRGRRRKRMHPNTPDAKVNTNE